MNPKDIKYYYEAIVSEECHCGREKKRGFSFCWKCYHRLPNYLKSGLQLNMRNGFEEAYEESVKFLED